MRFLHTSDWHIGRKLHTQSRFDEMCKFLDWLLGIIRERDVDALLLSGDVFDNTTPSVESQKIYYDFLKRARDVGSHGCQIVVVGGNHDSAALLDAPSGLCRALDIHVIGRAWRDNPGREVIVLRDFKLDRAGLIVCAVPFLRNADVRDDLGESDIRERQDALLNGIREHYASVLRCARQRQSEIRERDNVTVPIVVMGHLFARGGKIVEDDGVRELYVGNLNPCELDMFEPDICYTALGHIHVPQLVRDADSNGLGMIRYSGTPIPMGFGEAGQEKSVCIVTCPDNMTSVLDGTLDMQASASASLVTVDVVPIPNFQRLVSVRGDWDEIKARLDELDRSKGQDQDGQKIWLGVTYTGSDASLDIVGELKNYIAAQDLTGGPELEVLVARSDARVRAVESNFRAVDGTGLDSLTPEQVFERYLLEHGLGDPRRDPDSGEILTENIQDPKMLDIIEKRENLLATYKEAVAAVRSYAEVLE